MKLGWQLFLALIGLLAIGIFLVYESDESTESPLAPTATVAEELGSLPLEATAEEETEILEEVEDRCETESITFDGPVTVGYVGRPSTLNPLLLSRGDPFYPLSRLMFRGLVQGEMGEIAPDLASWEISEDGLEVTFTLIDNQLWEDGTPVTTDDVLFTYTLLKDPFFESLHSDWPLWSAIDLEIIDSQRIKFLLPESFSPMLAYANHGILPAHILQGTAPQGLSQHPFNLQPVGNGRFQIENDFQRDGFIIFEADPFKWSSDPFADQLFIRFYADYPAAFNGYIVDGLNLLLGDVSANFDQWPSIDGAVLYSLPSDQGVQLIFNLDEISELALASPSLTLDRQLREALYDGLDRQTLVDEVVAGQGIVFDGPYLPTSDIFNPELFPTRSSNILSATQALETAGWLLPSEVTETGAVTETVTTTLSIPLDSSGTVRTDGESLLTLDLLIVDRALDRQIGENLAEQWAKIGIEINLQTTLLSDYVAALENGQFDLALLFVDGVSDPDLYDLWSQEAIVRGKNWGAWNNRPASEALEAARFIWDFEERIQYYDAFMTLYQNDLPAISLYQPVDSILMDERLVGINMANGLGLHELTSSFNLWVIKEEGQDASCDA